MSTTNDLTQQAKNDFLDRNRDLLALTTNGPNDVFKRISAALALDSEAQDDVMMYAPLVDQPNYAGQVAREDFSREIYKAICKSFLEIQRNLVVTFAAKLTPEALEQLEDIEISAGARPPRPIVPPPPAPPTAAEQLEAEVRRDWVHLRSSEVKRKCNNAGYRAMFDKLMATGQLESFCTSLHDGAAEFRQ
ncbi:MAG: hypothetical protein JWO71_1303 [Candidatus Acidoferrum typicum]|nr:hypothetical protein [Candidatus Acidoferrum typicum]